MFFKKKVGVYMFAKFSFQQMKRYIFPLIILLILIIFALNNIFIVKQNEYKVVRQFGEIVRVIDKPGLAWKIPFLQSVTTLPKQKLVYDVASAEINTKDKKRIIIDNYSVWGIINPKQMIGNLRSIENAEAKMGEFIFSAVRIELGEMDYDQIVNNDKSNRGDLNQRITDKVNKALEKDHYGIKVYDVRIKRTDLPSENEQSVFKRMISERESKAQEYLSQGEAEKNRIIASTDKDVKVLLAETKAKASKIRAEGEGEAARIYNEAFGKDPEFYSLYRTLDSYKKTINNKTVLILPADSPYAKLLTEGAGSVSP